ncbi:MAG: ATPase [Gammaproteobacteria bacterium]|nr:ATPase [Gammaproteobacteria bacterium]
MTLLRPASTHWFEVLAPKDECSKSIGNLGRTGAVEIEVRPHDEELFSIRELAAGLDEYHQLSKRYHRYWSRGILRHASASYSQRIILERALTYIESWRVAADPLIDELQGMEEELTRLAYCQYFLNSIKDSDIDFSLTANAGPVLSVVSAILPVDAELKPTVPLLSVNVEHENDICFLAVSGSDDAQILRREIKAVNGRLNVRPPGLSGSAEDSLAQVSNRIEWLERHIDERYIQLDRLHEEYGLPDVLGDVICLQWFLEQVGTLEPAGTNLVWITGWTSEDDVDRLGDVLSEAGVPALVHSPPPPEGMEPPQILRNPWWSRPFEIFVRAFGTPSATEADPSPLLTVIVPLLFGYMFADVGQGLVLLAAGFWLKRHWEGAGLLIAAGISATLFGFLFGSIFSYEDLIPALLLHPLHDPLLTLSVPLLFGALLLVLGQLLDGLESLWSGEWRTWLLQHSGLLLLYVGALAGLAHADFAVIALIGAAWFVIGNIWSDGHWYALFTALGKLLEDGLRLLVNTVSFARVGAFALAHAGLSSALVALSQSVESTIGGIVIIVLGNALVIILEGLVVSIQTTRLVLFEFFMRFMRGSGRPFRPIASPPNVLKGELS